jgi:hypothetical protein
MRGAASLPQDKLVKLDAGADFQSFDETALV